MSFTRLRSFLFQLQTRYEIGSGVGGARFLGLAVGLGGCALEGHWAKDVRFF
jgi:hypothetical protein